MDPATAKVVGSIAVEGSPTDLTYGEGAIWIQLEAAGKMHAPLPMALRATTRGHARTVRTLTLAHCGYHPTVIDPDHAAVAALRAAFADA